MDKCVNEKLGKQKVTTMFLSTTLKWIFSLIEIFNFKLILIELIDWKLNVQTHLGTFSMDSIIYILFCRFYEGKFETLEKL